MAAPSWLAPLSAVPSDVAPEVKPVASAEQIANGTAGPIAGWKSVTITLSEPEFGLRHVQLTLDDSGALLAASDHTMFVRATTPDGGVATLTDHESVGGRFEPDGSFRGTWTLMTLECDPATDESVAKKSEQRPPSETEVAAEPHATCPGATSRG